MKGRTDLTPIQPGTVFGSLTVITQSDRRIRNRKTFLCRCRCGVSKLVMSNALKTGNTRSCGCEGSRTKVYLVKLTHGMAHTPEYHVWAGMKKRCYNQNDAEFKNYGARGITVCDEWKNDFAQFLQDVGRRPRPSLTIERIDNNKSYERGNVTWATRADQVRNTRRTVINLEIAKQLKKLRSNGARSCDIATQFGISCSLVSCVVNGRSWRDA